MKAVQRKLPGVGHAFRHASTARFRSASAAFCFSTSALVAMHSFTSASNRA
jgi:hypothetical protein